MAFRLKTLLCQRRLELWRCIVGNVYTGRASHVPGMHEEWKTVNFAFVRVSAGGEAAEKAATHDDRGPQCDEIVLDV